MNMGLQIYLVVVARSMGLHHGHWVFCGWLGRSFWRWLLGRFFLFPSILGVKDWICLVVVVVGFHSGV